ncbi:Hsp20/alpha crystallin family protein [Desulfopila sp. IMCC35006]|uniref:Hsp20/alpha crystallin family protein n=1 Tax=Desulfopila sp. IMCC35006 TaxID=2569542 RepID=UPI0010AD83E1|nr:Hsp20/alpha crystallin family protein [Desulfopila sp. IMCC35006]TKB25137.1 Hsp20/alpha crystallin family protein [Desulfopila sp. IMCC35006]
MNETNELATRKENMLEKRVELPKIAPAVDIFENEDEILLHADMPGVTRENVTVNVDNGKLEISGIRNLQKKGNSTWQEFTDVEYRRVFAVPQTIVVSKVHAELKEGVLKLHLPKAEESKPRTIKISQL